MITTIHGDKKVCGMAWSFSCRRRFNVSRVRKIKSDIKFIVVTDDKELASEYFTDF
jgi:hypothetical protein